MSRAELVKARDGALKELKKADVAYYKAEGINGAAAEKADEAASAWNEAGEVWEDAESEWAKAVRALAEYDAEHASEFI